jgi:sigma-B regulation protein RsbU (phosphoserine phosphatase)
MALALTGKLKGRSVRHFLRDGEQIVGRAATSHLRLADSSVSRTHARIDFDGERVVLTDMQSSNGTFVNGARITGPKPLEVGDIVGFADVSLRLVESEPLVDTLYSPNGSSIESSSVTLDEIYTEGEKQGERINLFRVLTDAGALLATNRPLDELYDVILDLVEKVADSDRSVLLLMEEEGDEPKIKRSHLKPGTKEGELVLSQTMVQKVIEERTGLLTSDAQQDPRFQQQQSIVSQGIRSAMAAPLFDNENVIGILYADTTNPGSWYTRDELRTFTTLANLMAVKITEAKAEEERKERERLARELDAAKDILSHILPTELKCSKGYELGYYHQPCLEVGGDLYEARCLEDGRALFLVGDVAGKGLGAAFLVTNIMPVVQVLIDGARDLAGLVERLNRQLFLSTDPIHYATLFIGVLDPSTGQIQYVNAGHNPPFLISADGSIEEVAATATPIGMLESAPIEAGEMTIRPGGMLVVFSDGIPEAQNTAGDFYEEDRLKATILEHAGDPAKKIVESVTTDLAAFVGEASPSDDVTIVLIKRLPETA